MQLCGVLIFLLELLLLQFSAVEYVTGVINHNLKVGLHLELGHLFDSLPQILPSKHNILNVLQRNGEQSDRVDGPSTVSNFVHGETVDLVHDATTFFDIFNLNILVLESEAQFNLTGS